MDAAARGLKPTATIVAPLRGARLFVCQPLYLRLRFFASLPVGPNSNLFFVLSCGSSRSDETTVAVGFSPRTLLAQFLLRRVATLDKRDLVRGKTHSSTTMANTFTCLLYHIVFSTKHREPWLRVDSQDRVWAYLGGIANRNKLTPLLFGGMEDHVHILLGIPATISVSRAVKQLKGGSSHWIKENIFGCRSFSWQDGYAAFSVSKSQAKAVEHYIRNQKEHHRVKTFQEEYRELLARHGIECDERYMWD